MQYRKHKAAAIIAVMIVCLMFRSPAQAAVIIEAEPDLQAVMGDLYALSVAMRYYHDEGHKGPPPTLDQLAHYLKKPLPQNWSEDYRTAAVNGNWWVGRRVPEFSRARRFLRNNSQMFGLYDGESRNAWMGGSFVWLEAVLLDGKKTAQNVTIVQGEGEDGRYLFFNSPGTDYYWWSNLFYTPDFQTAALKKYGSSNAAGSFVIPPPPAETPESITASPVSPPPDFTVGGNDEDEEMFKPVQMGDVIFNPLPRPRD